jgi:FkbM family methyltransferase
MNPKGRFKHWLYGKCPGFKGAFPYWGERVHFPPGSLAFDIACEQGIYEHENLRILQAAAKPGAWYIDIGANIGLMSAPLLSTEPTLNVVSVEASPSSQWHLEKTIAVSDNRNRWRLVKKAMGASEGEIDFFMSVATHGVFDGVRNTGRAPAGNVVKVQMTTLDALWTDLGKPNVCLVKIDVEGGEGNVLRGGISCLKATRPVVLLEWNRQNMAAYGCEPESLLEIAELVECDVLNVPALARVTSPSNMRLQTGISETFLLVPRR